MNGLQGQPQCRRKTTIVGLSGSFSFSCDGAWSPTFGTGATCFGGGDLKDWSSFVNICVSVGGAIFGCRACQGLIPIIMLGVKRLNGCRGDKKLTRYALSEFTPVEGGFEKGNSQIACSIFGCELDPAVRPPHFPSDNDGATPACHVRHPVPLAGREEVAQFCELLLDATGQGPGCITPSLSQPQQKIAGCTASTKSIIEYPQCMRSSHCSWASRATTWPRISGMLRFDITHE